MVRPRGDRDVVRVYMLSVKVGRLELARWKAAAVKRGLTPSAWLREALNRAARTG